MWTHPRHEGEDVVLLVLDGVLGKLLFTFLGAAEPDGPSLQLLLPAKHVDQAVAAAGGAEEENRTTVRIRIIIIIHFYATHTSGEDLKTF